MTLYCRSVSKKLKMELYRSIIRPVITCACGTWVLEEVVKTKLMVFERKVLRKIFGPAKKRDGTWRIKRNDELDKLIRHKNVINCMKKQRLIWFGHLHRMSEDRMVKKVYKWKPMLKGTLGRPKNRWKDDMKKLKIKNWTSCILDRNSWKLCVEKGKTFNG